MARKQLFLLVLTAMAAVANAEEEKDNPYLEHDRHGPPPVLATKSSLTTWDVYYAQVNNFNSTDNSTFAMRYNYNLEFCRQDGCPLVIYVGGEWEIDEGWLESGQIYEIARENGGAMFYTEHRFYGKSMPTTDFSSKSLGLLHSSQALEDLKGFITMLKAYERYANSKVFLFGCSYTGALVVWMKERYPELIQVTYSTSGPFQAQDSMYEYLQVISKDIYELPKVGPDCFNALYYGIQQLEQKYNSGDAGAEWVREKLGICAPSDPKGNYDRAALFQTFAVEFGNMGQEDPQKLPGACKALINAKGKTYADKLISYRGAGSYCYHADYDSTLWRYRDTSLSGTSRPWFYQQCNEFGWFETTETNKQAFGHSVLPFFYHQLCRDAYGAGFTDKYLLATQRKTNANYGGRYPKVRKSLFVYGSIDPWAPMGVTESLNDEALRFHIDGGDHCWDMYPQSSSDSASMTQAKVNTRAWVKKWLSE